MFLAQSSWVQFFFLNARIHMNMLCKKKKGKKSGAKTKTEKVPLREVLR